MTHGSATQQADRPPTAKSAGTAQTPLPAPWWKVSWSVPAALRAARATVVIPLLFAFTFEVLHDAQMTLFAVFGGFAALVMSSFGGDRKDKALAHLGLAVVGSAVLIIGTLASGSAWLAVVVTVPVAFLVYFAGSTGPNEASGVTGCLLAFVLPIASTGGVATISSRLEGWWLASAAATVAVLVLSPKSDGDQLRARAAISADMLASQLEAGLAGTVTAADTRAVIDAKHKLMNAFTATPYRPIGLATGDQGLASLIHVLEWCTTLICDALDGHIDLRAAAPADRVLLAESARALRQVAELTSRLPADPQLERLWRARVASARHLRDLSGDGQAVVAAADDAFHAQVIGVAASAAVGEALIASRAASPSAVAEQRLRWLSGNPNAQTTGLPKHDGGAARLSRIIASEASLRSVWFRNSLRGAIALAIAVAVAKLTDVQHAFWVVLGTVSVLRTNAAATGATALRALSGSVVGFAVGAALLLGLGTSPVALWIAFPIAVLVAAYTPGTAPFAIGQAAFTVTIVVLFNLLVPAGWSVGLLRVEDVAIGCAVSLVVGILFWPRGTSAVVGDNLADAFRCGADYLTSASDWALSESGHRPERALAAISSGIRLDDALRGFLTEQGSKRMAKADLWSLVLATTRVRLTAHTLASLPGGNVPPHADDQALHGELQEQTAELASFYEQLSRVLQMTQTLQPSVPDRHSVDQYRSTREAREPAVYRADVLWVSHHLNHLADHCAEVVGPASRLAEIRSRPWWR